MAEGTQEEGEIVLLSFGTSKSEVGILVENSCSFFILPLLILLAKLNVHRLSGVGLSPWLPSRKIRCPSQTEHHHPLLVLHHDCSNCLLPLWNPQSWNQG